MILAKDANDLWVRYKATNDPKLRQELIVLYAPLVKYAVGRLAIGLPAILDSEDIISHATIGMIEAIERFDPGRGLKFETYAMLRIRGSVIDTVRRLGIYPRGSRRRIEEIEGAIALLRERNGKMPTDEEVATYLGMTLEEYDKELLGAVPVILPLDSALRASDDDDPLLLSDVIEDERSPNPSEEAERAEMREALLKALNDLSERDRQLLALYYHEELTLKEISRIFDISESRVCQLHAKAIFKLRRSLNRDGLLATAAI